MKSDLAIEISKVTEIAALAAHQWIGRGDKNKADAAAVNTIRIILNQIDINGEIVTGEGVIDNAPMLNIGEKVGTGNGDDVDIAIDPIDGTRMTAMGQNNAVSIMAVSQKGGLLRTPDMYMEKLVVGERAKGVIDLNRPIMENLDIIARKLSKPLDKLTIVTLAKPRHKQMIRDMQENGIKVFAQPDGDVTASILTCMPENEIDVMYCIGGAPEGIISAAVVRLLNGDMQGRLMLRTDVKGCTVETRQAADMELSQCQEMYIQPGDVIPLQKLITTNNVLFSATGITHGDLLAGVTRKGNIANTETLLICGQHKVIRRINSTHYLDRKPDEIHQYVL